MSKSQYKSVSEWRKSNPKDYTSAYVKGYLPKICELMGWKPPQTKVRGAKWNDKLEVLRTEYINKCRDIINEINVDMDSYFVRGKKVSGVRIRNNTMKIRNLTDEFRREFSKLKNEL